MLGSILSGLVTAQRNGGIKAPLLYKSVEEEFCFKVPLAFVIGDIEGHDVLCPIPVVARTKLRMYCFGNCVLYFYIHSKSKFSFVYNESVSSLVLNQ